jgi:hypothetical protein
MDPVSTITILCTDTSINRGTNANATSITGENINNIIKLDARHNIMTEWGANRKQDTIPMPSHTTQFWE